MDEQAGSEVAADLAPTDAIACANDELALGLLSALRSRGADDVLLAGWDDVMAARYAGLTTVRQPMRELGGTAARLLDERIQGRTTPQHEVLPTHLVVRHSTTREGTHA
jgi:LacI family transcriptional regulator